MKNIKNLKKSKKSQKKVEKTKKKIIILSFYALNLWFLEKLVKYSLKIFPKKNVKNWKILLQSSKK